MAGVAKEGVGVPLDGAHSSGAPFRPIQFQRSPGLSLKCHCSIAHRKAHKAPAQLLKPHPERIGTVFVAGVLDREVYGTREAAAAAREAENRLRARP